MSIERPRVDSKKPDQKHRPAWLKNLVKNLARKYALLTFAAGPMMPGVVEGATTIDLDKDRTSKHRYEKRPQNMEAALALLDDVVREQEGVSLDVKYDGVTHNVGTAYGFMIHGNQRYPFGINRESGGYVYWVDVDKERIYFDPLKESIILPDSELDTKASSSRQQQPVSVDDTVQQIEPEPEIVANSLNNIATSEQEGSDNDAYSVYSELSSFTEAGDKRFVRNESPEVVALHNKIISRIPHEQWQQREVGDKKIEVYAENNLGTIVFYRGAEKVLSFGWNLEPVIEIQLNNGVSYRIKQYRDSVASIILADGREVNSDDNGYEAAIEEVDLMLDKILPGS